MKPIYFKNIVTGEHLICNNVKQDKQFIDGVEFLLVQKKDQPRKFLMRRDALQKLENIKHAS